MYLVIVELVSGNVVYWVSERNRRTLLTIDGGVAEVESGDVNMTDVDQQLSVEILLHKQQIRYSSIIQHVVTFALILSQPELTACLRVGFE